MPESTPSAGPVEAFGKYFEIPCVRTGLLWGIGCGTLAMAHKLRPMVVAGAFKKATAYRAAEWGVGACAASYCIAFTQCNTSLKSRQKVLDDGFGECSVAGVCSCVDAVVARSLWRVVATTPSMPAAAAARPPPARPPGCPHSPPVPLQRR